MKEKVLEVIIERASEILKLDPETLNAETLFADLNMKSLNYAQMTTHLEDEYDIEVPYMNFKRCKSFYEAAEYIVELLEE